MITIDNVISIDGYDDFAGSNDIDPAGIAYARPNPADSTQTLLYEEQKGGVQVRTWLIDETLANVVSNANTDAGWEVLVSYAATYYNEVEVDYNIALNPARIWQMVDNADDQAQVRFWVDNVQGLTSMVWDEASATVATAANATINQIDSKLVGAINEIELPQDRTYYYATALVDKDIPARTGYADLSTPEQVYISTYGSNKIQYTVSTGGSSS